MLQEPVLMTLCSQYPATNTLILLMLQCYCYNKDRSIVRATNTLILLMLMLANATNGLMLLMQYYKQY